MRKGTSITEINEGTGERIVVGHDHITVSYVCRLDDGAIVQTVNALKLQVKRSRIIPGLSYGLLGMRAGGKRLIRIDPFLAYGRAGVPGLIPPNAAITFEVELQEIGDGARTGDATAR